MIFFHHMLIKCLGETFVSTLDIKCLKVRRALIHRGLFQIKATHPISAKNLFSLHNDRQVHVWCYIFGQHGLPWLEKDEPSSRKDDRLLSYFPRRLLSLRHQSGIGLEKLQKVSKIWSVVKHSHPPMVLHWLDLFIMHLLFLPCRCPSTTQVSPSCFQTELDMIGVLILLNWTIAILVVS